MPEVLIPPYLQPQDETATLIDDSTAVFRPQMAPGIPQRVSFVEPRLQVKQSYKSLRAQERAAMLAVLTRAKGKYASVRCVVGFNNRGSFPDSELLSNNTLQSSSTGWSSNAEFSISAFDNQLRVTRIANTSQQTMLNHTAVTSYAQYAPHVARAFVCAANSWGGTVYCDERTGAGAQLTIGPDTAVPGMVAYTYVTQNGSGGMALRDSTWASKLYGQGSYVDVAWTSLQRCFMVDAQPNMLLQAAAFDNASWTKSSCSVTANADTSPDGSANADRLIEASGSAQHYVQQNITTTTAAQDICFSVCLKAAARTWAYIQVYEATSGTFCYVYINLSTGAIGTTSTGSNWSNLRYFVVSLGNSWYRLFLVARKTNVATSIGMRIGPASADNTATYTGDGASYIDLWRAGASLSGVPSLPADTTTNADTGSGVGTANMIQVKGLPVSTNGLLLPNDLVEINGELKLVMGALSSDAAGCGTLEFSPPMFRKPSDNDPVICGTILGKFILSENASWHNLYGAYADVDITLEAVNE